MSINLNKFIEVLKDNFDFISNKFERELLNSKNEINNKVDEVVKKQVNPLKTKINSISKQTNDVYDRVEGLSGEFNYRVDSRLEFNSVITESNFNDKVNLATINEIEDDNNDLIHILEIGDIYSCSGFNVKLFNYDYSLYSTDNISSKDYELRAYDRNGSYLGILNLTNENGTLKSGNFSFNKKASASSMPPEVQNIYSIEFYASKEYAKKLKYASFKDSLCGRKVRYLYNENSSKVEGIDFYLRELSFSHSVFSSFNEDILFKAYNLNSTFYDCESLTKVPNMDISEVYTAEKCFWRCLSLTTVPFLDSKNIRNIYCMFQYCRKLKRIEGLDISSVDVSNTNNYRYCFAECNSLNYIKLITSTTGKLQSIINALPTNTLNEERIIDLTDITEQEVLTEIQSLTVPNGWTLKIVS